MWRSQLFCHKLGSVNRACWDKQMQNPRIYKQSLLTMFWLHHNRNAFYSIRPMSSYFHFSRVWLYSVMLPVENLAIIHKSQNIVFFMIFEPFLHTNALYALLQDIPSWLGNITLWTIIQATKHCLWLHLPTITFYWIY